MKNTLFTGLRFNIIEIDTAFGMSDIFYSVDRMLIKTGQNSLASFIASNGPAFETQISEFNEAVKDLD